MSFKLEISMGFTEVFDTIPSQLRSMNLTAPLIKSLLLTRVSE